MTLLKEFSNISGYKVNLQKSELMPIGNAAEDPSVFTSTNFKICLKKFKYLGIWITHNFNELYKANYSLLLSKVKQDIERWDLLALSLGGRINTIKMNIFPKFLCLF